MLRREKPLAVFSEVDGDFVAILRRYLRMFDRHVKTGEFVKRELVESIPAGPQGSHRDVHLILYAPPEDVWRIDAMIELRGKLGAWTLTDERKEGMLLGYTDAENDAWIASRYGRK
ncbi:hypothetical protein GCM10008942_10660 [Rhizomicrobium electricum]|uniref:Uncharacterized protein n=2 Tax=Rhizomicrobium electricum TaxID=480070 RepID=A0ABN1ED30_9PROT